MNLLILLFLTYTTDIFSYNVKFPRLHPISITADISHAERRSIKSESQQSKKPALLEIEKMDSTSIADYVKSSLSKTGKST